MPPRLGAQVHMDAVTLAETEHGTSAIDSKLAAALEASSALLPRYPERNAA